METSAKLYSLNYSNVKTYLFALLFIAGNIALPQLCHLIPYGGPTLLPIYFFTLIAGQYLTTTYNTRNATWGNKTLCGHFIVHVHWFSGFI